MNLWGGRRRAVSREAGKGERVLVYSYARRVQEPPLERRYTLVLPAGGEAERLHSDALMTAAQAPRAYGETLLEGPWAALGVPLLRRLAPLALDSTVLELRRWTTPWLVAALRAAGFSQARGTAHPGELGRHFARDLLASDGMAEVAPSFEQTVADIGRTALALPGDEMVVAVR